MDKFFYIGDQNREQLKKKIILQCDNIEIENQKGIKVIFDWDKINNLQVIDEIIINGTIFTRTEKK